MMLHILNRGIGCAAATIAVLAFAAAPVQAATAQDGPKPLRYERVTKAAKLRNVASREGAIVADLSQGTLVAVYEDRTGFMSVEVPGGMGIWIYGKYARETEVLGVLEITAQNINMRPLPSSDVSSFPLKEKLHRGDRVRVITRANPGRPLESDWVKVWSPAGTRAWLATGSTKPIDRSEDGRALWASAAGAANAVKPAVSPSLSSTGTTGAPAKQAAAPSKKATSTVDASARPEATRGAAATQAAGPDARNAMESAEALMIEIRAGKSTDFEVARSGYQQVIQLAPRSVDAGVARARLDELNARQDVVRLENDMRAFEERRRQEVARAQDELATAQKNRDPLWGRLQARGWLEPAPGSKNTNASGEEIPRTYVIRWAGKVTTEVVCTSGRYDLSVFEGFEVGVTGVTTRAPIEASIGQPARPVRLDAARIEVISGRYQR
jgi:hypothetical protein